MRRRTPRIQRTVSLMLAVALLVPMLGLGAPAAVAADVDFVGGPILTDMPTCIPNDHTPMAMRFTASDLLPNTEYEVKIRLAPNPAPSNVQNRGYIWNPIKGSWTFNRGPSWGTGNFPTVTTDASGVVKDAEGKAQSPWIYFKFANELESGVYYMLVSLNATGEGFTRNASQKPTMLVLDMASNGTWAHNGTAAATNVGDERRVVVASSDSTDNANSILSIMRSEHNAVDDDANGAIDDESYGPWSSQEATGAYRLVAPANSMIDVWVQQNKRVEDAQLGGPDEDIALGAADMSAPTSPTALAAVAGARHIDLSWSASTDNAGVTGYNVYRWADPNDVVFTAVKELIGTTTGTTFVDDALPLFDKTYNYEVRAFDAATNVSARSAKASAAVATQATALTLAASSVVYYQGSTVISGMLKTAAGNPVAGQPVTVQISTDGTTWADWKTLTTGLAGQYSVMSPQLTTKRYFKAVFAGGSGYAASMTLGKSMTPKTLLSPVSAASPMYRNRAYTVTGTMKPRHTAGTYAAEVQAYRYESGKWVLRKTVWAKASNYYSYSKLTASISLPSAGQWKLRFRHKADAANALNYSTVWKYVTVR